MSNNHLYPSAVLFFWSYSSSSGLFADFGLRSKRWTKKAILTVLDIVNSPNDVLVRKVVRLV